MVACSEIGPAGTQPRLVLTFRLQLPRRSRVEVVRIDRSADCAVSPASNLCGKREQLQICIEAEARRDPVMSQPLSVKSTTKIQDFSRNVQRTETALRHTQHDLVYRLRHGVSQGKLGRIRDSTGGSHNKSFVLNAGAGARTGKGQLLRSKSTVKGMQTQHARIFLAYMSAAHSRDARVVRGPAARANRTRLAEIYGDTGAAKGNNNRRNANLAQSQCINISRILHDSTAFPTRALSTKKHSGKHAPEEESIEEMHMALVAHYQRVKRMLRRVEVPGINPALVCEEQI